MYSNISPWKPKANFVSIYWNFRLKPKPDILIGVHRLICVFDFTSGSGGNISLLLKHKFDFDITKELAHTNNLNSFRFEIRDFVITSQNCIGIEGQNSNNF